MGKIRILIERSMLCVNCVPKKGYAKAGSLQCSSSDEVVLEQRRDRCPQGKRGRDAEADAGEDSQVKAV